MNKAEYAVMLLKQYAKENQVPPRSTSDTSPLEQWLMVRLHSEWERTKSDFSNPFIKLLKLSNETTGATFQYYFNKSEHVHVIAFTSLRTSFSNESFHAVIKEAEDFVIEKRRNKDGIPKFTLLS